MAAEKYLLFNLEDDKSKKLGEILGNKACKKIINLLAEKELGASEIAKNLEMPLNTVTYNISKLIEAGLIEESKSFWSVKGKKMPSYKLVNKAIVISPKKGNIYNKIKGVLPVIITAGVFTGFILWESVFEKFIGGEVFVNKENAVPEALRTVADNSASGATAAISTGGFSTTSWVLIGIWIFLLIFIGWSIFKKKD